MKSIWSELCQNFNFEIWAHIEMECLPSNKILEPIRSKYINPFGEFIYSFPYGGSSIDIENLNIGK